MGGLRMKNAIISGSDLRMSQLTQNEAMVGVDLQWGHWMKCSLGLFVSVCITAGLHQHLTNDIIATWKPTSPTVYRSDKSASPVE